MLRDSRVLAKAGTGKYARMSRPCWQKTRGKCWPTRPPQVRTRLTSRCAGAKHEVEVCSHGERAEVPVARDERNALVDTALGDQRIAETRLASFYQHLSPQRSRPLPVARCDFDQRYF